MYTPTPPEEQGTMQSGTLRVLTSYPDGHSEGQEQEIEVRAFFTETASVTSAVKRVINTGNYESIHLEARVTLPCYVEEVPLALERSSEIVGLFIAEAEDGLRGMLGQKTVWNLSPDISPAAQETETETETEGSPVVEQAENETATLEPQDTDTGDDW